MLKLLFLLWVSILFGQTTTEILKDTKALVQAKEPHTQGNICQLLDELMHSSCIFREGSDEEQRPLFVRAQAAFERLFSHLLSIQKIQHLTCIIHAPAPATPLCTEGTISHRLVDISLSTDANRLFTVAERPTLLRAILQKGGDIFSVHPANGRCLRSPEQLSIFDDLLKEYPSHLFEKELDCLEMPLDLTGAIYFFSIKEEILALSIQSYQANCPTDGKWSIWFGKSSDPLVAARLISLNSFLKRRGCCIPALDAILHARASVKAYFDAFPELRSQEKWSEIIALGKAALEDSPSLREKGSICGQLASTYFYQGELKLAEHHATCCYEIACQRGDTEEQVHGLYLLSAMARAQGEFARAKAYVAEALPQSEGKLKAKILFNLGAAESEDPQGDLSKAKEAFLEASSLFTCPEDKQRTALRLGKIYLLTGHFQEAEQTVKSVFMDIQTLRISMHADYLHAQIEKAKGNLSKALHFGTSALEKAHHLGAKRDAERIHMFCQILAEKLESPQI